MRYLIYRDAHILGPYEREELGQAGPLHPETLVCVETLSGRLDTDWKCLEEIPDLAGLASSSLTLAASFEYSETMERRELESLGMPASGAFGGWVESLFQDKDFRALWGEEAAPKAAELEPDSMEDRIGKLTAELEALKARKGEIAPPPAGLPLARPEPEIRLAPSSMGLPLARPEPELRPAPLSAGRADDRSIEPPAVAPSSMGLPLAPPEKDLRPGALPSAPREEKALAAGTERSQEPEKGLKFNLGRPAQAQAAPAVKPIFQIGAPKIPSVASAKPAEEAAPPSPGAKPPEDARKGTKFTLSRPAQERETASKTIPKLGTAKSFQVVAKPAAPTQTPAPAAAASEIPKFFAQTPPPPVPTTTPPPAAEPPAGTSPRTATFAVPPLHSPSTGSFPMPPMTMTFSASALPAVRAGALTPSRANAAPAATPVASPSPATEDVLARLAKPTPAPAAVEKPKRKSPKVFLIASAVLLAALVAMFYLFFRRNSNDLKEMVDMGSGQKSAEASPEGVPGQPRARNPAAAQAPRLEETAPPISAQAAPAAVSPQAGTAVEAAQTKKEPSPAPAADPGQEAIGLVKGYPLDGGRGTVGQWLQYSFTANPGDGNKEEWTAGAVDATTMLVQYRVLPGGKAVGGPITYLFEADASRQTVRGRNPQARQLMGGGGVSRSKKVKPAKPARKRAARRKASPAKKKLPLLPLPSDAQLMPRADGGASLNSDIVR